MISLFFFFVICRARENCNDDEKKIIKKKTKNMVGLKIIKGNFNYLNSK